jgi:sterol desaturase/sphingolipid hydroxylase (fatty acid hydroxylase superfamily)
MAQMPAATAAVLFAELGAMQPSRSTLDRLPRALSAYWEAHRPDWSIRGDREIGRDLGHSVLYTTIGGNVAQLMFLYGFASMLARLGLANGLGLWPVHSPVVVQVLTVVVLGDLLEYWYHRLAHTVPWLWPLHAVHHTPVRLHVLKAARHHFLYYSGRGLFVWVPLMPVGAPPGLVVWQFVVVVLTGAVSHANIAFRIPAFVHLLVTPEFHRLHHSIDAKQGNSSYATVLPTWDMIFGTQTDPMVAEARKLGIEQDLIPRRFLSELLAPVTFYCLVSNRPYSI